MALIVPRELPGIDQLLFKLIGANMNVTTDQIFNPVNGGPGNSHYRISAIYCTNASTSLTTAAGGVYNAISKPSGANILVAAAQAYSTLTASTSGFNLTLNAAGNGLQAGITPVFSLTTGQGSAATADLYIFGMIMDGV